MLYTKSFGLAVSLVTVTERGCPKSRLVFLGAAGANAEFGNGLLGPSRQAHLLLCNTTLRNPLAPRCLGRSFTRSKARVGWSVGFVLVCRCWDVGVLFEDPLFSESISTHNGDLSFKAKFNFDLQHTRSMMFTPSSRLKSRPVGTRLFSRFLLCVLQKRWRSNILTRNRLHRHL